MSSIANGFAHLTTGFTSPYICMSAMTLRPINVAPFMSDPVGTNIDMGVCKGDVMPIGCTVLGSFFEKPVGTPRRKKLLSSLL